MKTWHVLLVAGAFYLGIAFNESDNLSCRELARSWFKSDKIMDVLLDLLKEDSEEVKPMRQVSAPNSLDALTPLLSEGARLLEEQRALATLCLGGVPGATK
jgi:hypothetical protein